MTTSWRGFWWRRAAWLIVVVPAALLLTQPGPIPPGGEQGLGFVAEVRPGADPSAVAAALDVGSDLAVDWVYTEAVQGFAGRVSGISALRLLTDPRIGHVEWLGWSAEDRRVHPRQVERLPRPAGERGVRLYVVDSGVETAHAEFTEIRVLEGFDAYAWASPRCLRHGTAVAGAAAGRTTGVVSGIDVVSVRALDCSGTAGRDVLLAALDWIARVHAPGDPGVVNLSMEFADGPLVPRALSALAARGLVVVAAAGNDGRDSCAGVLGAAAEDVIVVGAVDEDRHLARYGSGSSGIGACVDIWARGRHVPSASTRSEQAVGTFDGTSLAAPQVAGRIAAVLQQAPTLSRTVAFGAVARSAEEILVPGARAGYKSVLDYQPAAEPDGGCDPGWWRATDMVAAGVDVDSADAFAPRVRRWRCQDGLRTSTLPPEGVSTP